MSKAQAFHMSEEQINTLTLPNNCKFFVHLDKAVQTIVQGASISHVRGGKEEKTPVEKGIDEQYFVYLRFNYYNCEIDM